ncbi:MAG: extracellular solute-binding protein [Gammaproteobacteria bacterium]|jgi:putative spermidine/putrescine transport system substrate-binding protein/spermidine/putrescine transport system substrate-binding protein|nr:extracellular solute-binding protein [Gammaproteobacteria bacterium]|tara:strand:- start:892 stop:2028 length:1137 start_codon:yes stop_codon:yes gene_type:complete
MINSGKNNLKKAKPLRSSWFSRQHRARLLAWVGAVLLTGALMSCQKADEGADSLVDLTILEWSGYQQAQYHPEFNAKYGGQPAVALFAEEEDAMQRMRNGFQADLVHLCASSLAEARDSGLIKPLDISRIPRWSDINPSLLAVKDVQVDDEYWIAPWDWGYSTVAYNPELIDIENATYDIFIDPRFKGKTALPSSTGVNFIITGIIGGWADPLDPTETEMEAAPEIFRKLLGNARFIWSDGTQLEQAWVAGDVGISYVYGSASIRMKKEGIPIVVVKPLMTWMCGLSLAANGAGSEDQAYDYINAMLDPQSGVALFDVYSYGHGNSKTVDLIDPDRVVGTGIDDATDFFTRGLYTGAMPPEKEARLFQLWYEAQAGLE